MATRFQLLVIFLNLILMPARATDVLPVINVYVPGKSNILESEMSQFNFTRSITTSNYLTVYYETIFSSDVVDLQYPLGNSVSIYGGSTIGAVGVWPRPDVIPEPDLNITLRLLPSTNYIIGPQSEATITIRDNDSWWGISNGPPSLKLAAITNVVSAKSNLVATVTANDALANSLLIQLLANEEVVAESTAWTRTITNVTLRWTNPPPGRYMISARGFDELGAHTNTQSYEVLVAVDVVHFSLFGQSFYEWDVPANATNLEAFVRLSSQSPYGEPAQRFYAYIRDANSNPPAAREYVGTMPSLGERNPIFEVDVTDWARRAAGRKLGLEIVPDNPTDPQTTMRGFDLYLFTPETRERAPLVTWRAKEGPLVPQRGDTITLNAQVVSPDSRVWNWNVMDGTRLVYISTASLPAGTNFLSAPISNLSTGLHKFRIEASSIGWMGISEPTNIFVVELGRQPQHRWLGSGANTKSYYVVDDSGRAFVWGENNFGQLGLGFTSGPVNVPMSLPAPEGLEFRQIVAGPRHTVAVMNDGSLWGWGANNLGQIKLPTTNFLPTPTRIPLPTDVYSFQQAIADTNETIYVQDQSRRFWPLPLRGAGVPADELSRGGMGSLSLNNGVLTAPVPAIYMPAVTRWIDISAGPSQMLIIGTNFQMYGWGYNSEGQLPLPAQTQIPFPTLITNVPSVSGWTRVEAGRYVSLATDLEGRLFWWGIGFDRSEAEPNVAKEVQFGKGKTNWVDFTVTATYAMALDADGELFVWNNAGVEMVGIPVSPQAQAISATLSGGDAVFRIAGPKNVPVVIELSSDLVTWFRVEEIPNPTGQIEYVAPADEEKFFLRVAPPR